MKNVWIAVIMLISVSFAAAKEPEIKTEEQKILYTLGVALSQNVKQFDIKAEEADFIARGLIDSLKNGQLKVDYDAYGSKIGQFVQARQAAKAEKSKKAAKPFLDKAAKEKGAQVSPSGLIYTEIKKGKGASPKATDNVKVHYHGTLTDGKVFDSSVDRKTPAEFPLNAVIPCWTEGVLKMKIGGKAKLVCPSSIAYGDNGRPPVIPGGAPLVFEVELLDIVKADKPAAAKTAPAKPAKAPKK
ncbi:MAG: FKBP-type peptidyl-prolyl cis-trans isomerase [bacterium]